MRRRLRVETTAQIPSRSDPRASTLLWVDCTGGAVAGLTVLVLSGWLGDLYRLPRTLLLFTAAVNLLYACYSFSLARRRSPSLGRIKLLAIANAAWVPVCLALAVIYWQRASWFGIGHLVGEAVFVGALAAMEWKAR